jgi:hypothetical protein
MKDTVNVELPREILVKNKKVKTITVRIPKIRDDLNASNMARFQTNTGYMQVDELEKEVYLISAVTNIPKSDIDNLNRTDYSLLVDAVGKLELASLSPTLEKESEENK